MVSKLSLQVTNFEFRGGFLRVQCIRKHLKGSLDYCFSGRGVFNGFDAFPFIPLFSLSPLFISFPLVCVPAPPLANPYPVLYLPYGRY